MSWRINQIEVKNFKFFKNTFTLKIDRKNILLYGENGSGKSSIYWSVFTHFQAYAKEQAEAQKYFTANHSQNLRNRFVDESEGSYIKISFHDGNSETKSIVDSDVDYYPANEETLRFMRGTAMSSDFLNYKILSSLFDFKNSEDNQVFSIFEKEILPYIDFDEPYQKIDGTSTDIQNAGEWWGYIKRIINTEGVIPRNEKKYSNFNRGTAQYKAYQERISSFNRLLKNKLQFLVLRANTIIEDVFNIEAKIELTVSDAIFNRYIGFRNYSATLESPKIYLKARMTSSLLANDALIEHPRSFFNEAKITCMALALRLAILEDHATTDELLNPFSHDDIETPFYRRELEKTIEEIEQLGRIHKNVIVDYEKVRTVEYKMRVTKDEESNDVTIMFLEQFNSFEYNGNIYYSNPKVFVRDSYNEGQIQCKEWGLNKLLDRMCHYIGHNAATKQKIQDSLYDMGGNLLI